MKDRVLSAVTFTRCCQFLLNTTQLLLIQVLNRNDLADF